MGYRYDTIIKAEGIGNQPKYYETEGEIISVIELNGRKYEAFDVGHNDDSISFSTQWRDDDTDELIDELIRMNPEKVFELYYYSNGGWSESYKCGIFGGEFKLWDKTHWDIYEDIAKMEAEDEGES